MPNSTSHTRFFEPSPLAMNDEKAFWQSLVLRRYACEMELGLRLSRGFSRTNDLDC
jgi:hypothetical protein